MPPLRLLLVYASTLAAFLLLDLAWLGVVAREHYRRHLGGLMRDDPAWGAALLFYALYVTGVLVLAVWPAVEASSGARALGLGAILGLVAYAAWNLTNLAVLRDFPAELVPLDLAWGTALTGATAWIGWRVATALGG